MIQNSNPPVAVDGLPALREGRMVRETCLFAPGSKRSGEAIDTPILDDRARDVLRANWLMETRVRVRVSEDRANGSHGARAQIGDFGSSAIATVLVLQQWHISLRDGRESNYPLSPRHLVHRPSDDMRLPDILSTPFKDRRARNQAGRLRTTAGSLAVILKHCDVRQSSPRYPSNGAYGLS